MCSHILLIAVGTALLVPQDIDVRPRFRAGEEYRFEVTRSIEDSRPSQAASTVRRAIHVRVLSAESDGYELEWSSRPSSEAPAAIVRDIDGLASQIGSEATLRIRLTARGQLTAVTNRVELLRVLTQARDKGIKTLVDQMVDSDRARAESTLRQLLSPETLISLAMHDVQRYTSMYGQRLALDNPIEFDSKSVTPLHNTPVPIRLRFSLLSVTESEAVLEDASIFDPKVLRSVTDEFFKASAGKGVDEAAPGALEMTENARYVYDRRSGVMRDITYERRMNIGAARRIERWTARLTAEPPR